MPPAAPPAPAVPLPAPLPSPSVSAPPHRPARAALVFVAVTFAISWSGAIAAHFVPALGGLLMWIVGAGPAIGAVVAGLCVMKRSFPGLDLHPRFNKRALFILAVGLPFLIALLADGVTALVAGSGETGRQWLPPNVMDAVHLLIVLALLEEIGWRGILYPCLRKHGVIVAGLVTGFIWGIWHAPWQIMDMHLPWSQVGLFVAMTTVASIPLGILTNRSGSIFPATVAHASWNYAAASGLILTVERSNMMFYAVALFVCLVVVAIASLAVERTLSGRSKSAVALRVPSPRGHRLRDLASARPEEVAEAATA